MNKTTSKKLFLGATSHIMNFFIILMLSLFSANICYAGPISEQQAEDVAARFLTMRHGMLANGLTGLKLEKADCSYSGFYIFNLNGNKGFVIISGDDRTYPVLGYSDNGSFDELKMNDNMKSWLEGYSRDISVLKESGSYSSVLVPDKKFMTPIRKNVVALVPSRWNQKTPFNNLCPKLDNDTENRPTGCVATAMAQVMYYYCWPEDYTAQLPSYTYTDNPLLGGANKERFMPELPSIKFKWSLMKDFYDDNLDDEAANNAVAELMQYCGQSVMMMYCPQASGALSYNIPNALRECFGYDKGVRYVDRDEFSTEQWEDLIYNEVANGRPVLYSGSAKTGGHQFVCDGYENGFFHINWGWSGMSDGFFRLSVLNPEIQGVGGAGNGMNFSDAQEAVIGICRPMENSTRPEEYPSISNLATDNFSGRYIIDADGTARDIRIMAHMAYSKTVSEMYTIALAFCKDGSVEKVISEQQLELKAGHPLNDCDFLFALSADDIAKYDGHTINMVYKNESGNWILMKNYERVYMRFAAASDHVLIEAEPKKKITIDSLSLDGPQCAGATMTLVAKITNNGDEISGSANVMIDGVPSIFSSSMMLHKNSSVTVRIPFEVPDKDEINVSLGLNGSIISESITVAPRHIKRSKLDFEVSGESSCGGDFISVVLNVINKKSYEYYHAVGLSLYEKDRVTGDKYLVETIEKSIDLEASATTAVSFKFESLKPDTEYAVVCHYYYNNGKKYYGGYGSVLAEYRTLDSAVAYLGNGTKRVVDEADGLLSIPSDACFVYMPYNLAGRKLVVSDNANCLYYFNGAAEIPEALNAHNVIVDGAAEKIVIDAASNFYCPVDFMAAEVEFSKNINDGTSSLCIPFTPSEMSINGTFSDFNDDIRLLQYTAESDDTIYFDYADGIISSVPYLIYAEKKYDGAEVMFMAYDTEIKGSAVTVPGKKYGFSGSMSSEALANGAYSLSGNSFVKSDVSMMVPFEAYCISYIPNNDRKEIFISLPDDIDTGIDNVMDVNSEMVNIFDISGMPVARAYFGTDMLNGLPNGIYVVNGKKYIKK